MKVGFGHVRVHIFIIAHRVFDNTLRQQTSRLPQCRRTQTQGPKVDCRNSGYWIFWTRRFPTTVQTLESILSQFIEAEIGVCLLKKLMVVFIQLLAALSQRGGTRLNVWSGACKGKNGAGGGNKKTIGGHFSGPRLVHCGYICFRLDRNMCDSNRS